MPRSLRVAPKYLENTKSALLRNGFARQQDLAEYLGISRDTVSRFFNGRRVGYLNFYEICHRLELNLEYIAADFGTTESSAIDSLQTSSLCNLPHRNYSQLIGREEKIQELLKYISPNYRQHMTIVQGIGGIGKTSLVIEAAYRCWEAKQNKNNFDPNIPIFDAIIFTSAKDTDLLPYGFISRPIKEVTLQDIFRTIAQVLNEQAISQASNEKKIEMVYESLKKQQTLLIIDNMETIKGRERDDILSFLNNLPNTVQSIITTREKVLLFTPISLRSLSEQDSIQLIQQQAQIKQIKLTEEQSQKIYQRFGGIPLALIYLVGKLAGKYSLKKLLDSSVLLPEDVASFCFEVSVKPLRNKPAHSLLMSMAIFRTKAEWKALAKVAGLQTEPLVMEQGLEKLKQLSLVYQEDDKYKILPITREYALSELVKFPTFEQQARERWIEYYIEFTQKYGGKDWKNWRVKYDALEQEWSNTLQVLDWCAANGRYDDVIKIWKNVDNYIDLKGDWDTLLKWWEWLEKQSIRRDDWPIYIDALSAQAWISILKGSQPFAEAKAKISDYCEVEEENEEIFEAKASFAIVHSILLKIEQRYEKSLNMLKHAKTLIENADILELYRSRYFTQINYYIAEIFNCSEYPNHDREQAKNLFEKVSQQGEKIGWSRIVNYAQNDLANIAILEKKYDKATQIIEKGLREAKRARENARIGHWLVAYWRLEIAKSNLEQAEKYAYDALSYFSETSGLIRDAEEIKLWLKKRKPKPK